MLIHQEDVKNPSNYEKNQEDWKIVPRSFSLNHDSSYVRKFLNLKSASRSKLRCANKVLIAMIVISTSCGASKGPRGAKTLLTGFFREICV